MAFAGCRRSSTEKVSSGGNRRFQAGLVTSIMSTVTESVRLGEIDTPSGTLILLDPGLGRFWRHDGDPRSPNSKDPECVDMVIVGPDAEAAGRAQP